MTTTSADQIIEQAKALSASERRRVAAEILRSIEAEEGIRGHVKDLAPAERERVMQKGRDAIKEIQKISKVSGLDKMTQEEIDAEIDAVRMKRLGR